jgi:outer membrane protein assembly factor BamB
MLSALTLAVLLASTAAQSADWPQWRGLERNGVSLEKINLAWPASGPDVAWRSLVGTGFSSIAVSSGRVYTMGNSNHTDSVWCLDAKNGKPLWRHQYAAKLDPQYYEGGPSSTPTIHEGRVYTLSKWGSVYCLDATNGSVVWHHDLWQEGIRSNRWGFAGSPLVWKDLLILNAGSAGTALELKTGKLAWSSGTNVAGYASPTLYRAGDKEVVLIFATDFLAAVDPRTGKELWRRPFKTSYNTNNTDPLPVGDRILISSFSRGAELLAVKENAPPDLVYETKELKNHLSPGIPIGDFLYAFHGEAKFKTELRCIHIPTGEVKWHRTDPAFGSMIRVGSNLLLLSDKGELIAGEPSPEGFRELARARILDGVSWTPPALADGHLYARNATGTLVCVDLSK